MTQRVKLIIQSVLVGIAYVISLAAHVELTVVGFGIIFAVSFLVVEIIAAIVKKTAKQS